MANLIQRAKLALTVFQRGMPYPSQTKQARSPFMWPAWRNDKPQWILSDFTSYATEGFSQNSLIYSAIMYKARAMASAPLRAYGGDPDQPELLDVAHPLAQLVARPNPYQSWLELQMLNEVYLNIAGEVFVLCARPRGGGLPEALYTLRPDRVYLVPKGGKVAGWLYVPEGQSPTDGVPILAQDMMTVKLPNPLDPYEGFGRGLSPLAPTAQSADVDNAVTAYLKTFFDNAAVPQGLLKFEVPLSSEEMARIRERWKEIYGGVDNWAEVGVLDQTGEYQRLGMSFNEMGFESIDERNESRILGPLGVPPILIGTRMGLMRSTYSNYEEARRAFWQDTLVPELRLYEDEYRYFLQSDDGGFVRFDLGDVPALQQDKGALVTAAQALFSMGVPANQALAAMGLDIGEVEGGDIGYLPLSLNPVGQPRPAPIIAPPPAVEPKPEPDTEPETDNEGAPEAEEEATEEPTKALAAVAEVKGWTPEQKAALWQKADRTATAWEPKFADACEKAFENDRRALQARLTAAKKKALERKAAPEWDPIELEWREYLANDAPGNWRTAFRPAIEGIVKDANEHWSAVLGIEFDVRNLLAERWFEQYLLKFAQPIIDTSSNAMSEMLQQARREGWGIDTMSKHLDTMFQQWSQGDVRPEDLAWYQDRAPEYRRQNIARTESMRSLNAGTHELFKEYGVQEQEWITTIDGRERDSHREVNKEVRKIGDPFLVGGWPMMYPGDPSAPPSEVCNCRCSLLPVVKTGEEVRPEPARPATVEKPQVVEQPRAFELPEPPSEYMSQIREFSNRMVEALANREGITPNEAREICAQNLRDAFDSLPISIRRGRNGALGVVRDGRFKTQFETGTSSGLFDLETRAQAELQGLGVSIGSDPAKRPVYGYLSYRPDTACGYGDVEFVLKESARERATYTVGDSLDGFADVFQAGRPLSGRFDDAAAWGHNTERIYRKQYNRFLVEIQVQNGVTINDIEQVVLHKGAWIDVNGVRVPANDAYQKVVDLAGKRGMRVEYADSQ